MSLNSRLLVIDDEIGYLNSLKTFLERHNYTVDIAANGSEAIQSLEDYYYDVVITDLIMPDIDGFGVMEYIRQRELLTQIIAITGNASIESAVAAIQQGCFDYLIKPFSYSELLIKVEKILEKTILEGVGSVLTKSFTVRQALPEVMSLLGKIIDFDSMAIMLLENKSNEFYLYSEHGFIPPVLKNGPLKLEGTMSEKSIKQQAPMINNDFGAQRFYYDKKIYDSGIASGLFQPLLYKNQEFGVLVLLSHKANKFKHEQFNITSQVANALAVALENSKLIDKIVESESKFRTLVETMNNGLIELDENHCIIYANHNFQTMIERNIHEIYQQNLMNFIVEEDQERLSKSLQEPIKGNNFSFELNWKKETEGSIPTIISGAPLFDKHNNFVSTFAVITDISKEKEREKRLEELNTMKDDFIRVLSHDLRSPLNNILACTQLLTAKYEEETGDQPLFNVVKNIDSAAKIQMNLLNDLMDIIISESGNIKLNRSQSRIENILDQSISAIEVWAKNKGIEIIKSIPPNLPAIFVDKPKIIQVFNNFLANAVKFNDRGGKVEILVNVLDHQYVEIQVRDTGIGIEQTKLKHLFDSFIIKTTHGTEGEKGTGLGLAICNNLIKLHQGSIHIESQKNKGTTVYVRLPING